MELWKIRNRKGEIFKLISRGSSKCGKKLGDIRGNRLSLLSNSRFLRSFLATPYSIVRGYHVYRNIWSGAIGQILLCQQEPANIHDPYTVAV